MSLLRLSVELPKHGIRYAFQIGDAADIHFVRNLCASWVVQEEQFTHLFFVDHDMDFAISALTRPLNADKDVIAFVCPKRRMDVNALMNAARQFDNATALARTLEFTGRGVTAPTNKSDPVAVRGTGAALMLIKRSALLKMVATGKVRTQTKNSYQTAGLRGPLYGFFDTVFEEQEALSEDASFCVRYRELTGGQVFAFIDEDIGHVGPFTYRAKLSDRLTS